jgi:integrase
MARKKKPAKEPRRKPGTGTIRFKEGRERPWEAEFPLGRGLTPRYDSFSTRQEAAEHLDRLVEERRSKEAPRNVAGGSRWVRDFLPAWLEIKRPHIKPKTFHGYQYLCELASGEIGGYRVDEVTREVANSMLAFFHGRDFKNVTQMRNVLRQAFEYALEEEYIKRNPFQRAKAPKVERRKSIALTEGQRAALLAVYGGHPLAGLFHLYSRVGLRKGEGEGLRWADVDWEEGTISVEQQFTEINGRATKSTPKTPKSRRTIPIPADLLELLRQHYKWQRQHAAACEDWQELGLVFPSDVGTPLGPSNINRLHKSMLKKAGLPEQVTIHDLRHTALYLIEQGGAPDSVLMSLAGHTSATMAKHYTDHADIEAVRRAVEKSG